MKPGPAQPEMYLYLQEDGIDIDACKVDYKVLSVRCEDLSLYKKAFRVKIRALIKQNSMTELKAYVNEFYTLAHFVRYLYGFNSCASEVEPWQETLAYDLQTKFVESKAPAYTSGSWIEYKRVSEYKELFTQAYKNLSLLEAVQDLDCVQDEKPFLNPKDKAHFDKCLEMKEIR